MEVKSFFTVSAQLSWQGGVVFLLLFLPIFISKILQKIPRDLLFAVSALLTVFIGVVSSAQIYHSGINQTIFTILGLWLIGKAMQHNGVFQSFISFLSPVTKDRSVGYLMFFLQVILFGAFLNHRYFPLTTLRPLSRQAEKEHSDLRIYGFPFFYLFLIGGLATAIGSPINILMLSLYSPLVGDDPSDLFAFFPLAITPILISLILFLFIKQQFRKPFSQFIDAASCAIVPPDSLLINQRHHMTTVREGKTILKSIPLQGGDLILFSKNLAKTSFARFLVFSNASLPIVQWKKLVVIAIFLCAILATFLGVSIGTAFLLAGIILLIVRATPFKKAFQEEFPLPLILEVFSAYMFFYAMQNSGLNAWIAALAFPRTTFLLLPLFFLLGQILAHFMPRPIAFVSLFSIALAIVFHPTQLLLIGISLAFAITVPLFGNPLIDETAMSNAISGKSPLAIRFSLILILFLSLLIPAWFLWRI